MHSSTRIANLDLLRGIAALSVCAYHFGGNGLLGAASPLFDHGRLGVAIFFVISGFIIPTALFRSDYALSRHWGNFLARRFVRLYPAFFAVLLLQAVVLSVADHAPWSWPRFLTNMTFTAGFAGQNWYVPPFWTLAIEEQFYALIALIFPLLVHRGEAARVGLIGLFLFTSVFVGAYHTIFPFLPLFSLGILAFLFREGLLRPLHFAALALAAITVQYRTVEATSAIAAGATCAFIVFAPELRQTILHRVGAFSYSLYLIHFVVGGVLVKWAEQNVTGLTTRAVIAAGSLALSIAAAYLLYLAIERPTNALSKRLKSRRAIPLESGQNGGINGRIHSVESGMVSLTSSSSTVCPRSS